MKKLFRYIVAVLFAVGMMSPALEARSKHHSSTHHHHHQKHVKKQSAMSRALAKAKAAASTAGKHAKKAAKAMEKHTKKAAKAMAKHTKKAAKSIASSAQTAAAQAHQLIKDNPELARQAASVAYDRAMSTKFGQKIHDGVIDAAAKVSGQDRDTVAAMASGMADDALGRGPADDEEDEDEGYDEGEAGRDDDDDEEEEEDDEDDDEA